MTTAEDINAAIAARHRFPSALKEAIGDVIGPMIDALGAPAEGGGVSVYESPWTAIGTLNYVFAHGLGAIPFLSNIELKCITTEHGLPVGTILAHCSYKFVNVRPDSTNVLVEIQSASAFYAVNTSTHTQAALNSSKWEFRLKAVL